MCANHDSRCHDAPPCCAIFSRRPVSSIPSTGRGFSERLQWHESLRRRRNRTGRYHNGILFMLSVIFFMSFMMSPAHAALVNFDNCLEKSILDSKPLQLQFIPLDVDVTFDAGTTLHPLNFTVYGNVSGTADRSSPMAPDNPQWANPNNTVGKIVDLSTSNNKYTTLLSNLQILNFNAYSHAERFCGAVGQGTCPLGPLFYTNVSNLTQLYAFSFEHDMDSTYAFSTISSNFLIKSGDASAASLGCITVNVTPDLGSSLKNALRYVPLVILLLVGIATVVAAMYSPWGSTNLFRWTCNYGSDEDVLRLVTPGFADCLQYIQFVVLTGALSLKYPGYYQPVVSQASWSSLMFNQSFVSAGDGRTPVADGVYTVNGTYGLDQLSKLVGMEASKDTWPGMIIWTLAVIVGVTVLVQVIFALRWLHRQLAHIPEEDRRARNLPFTIGNVIRVVFNYLLLPVTSISLFQLVVASQSPAYSVALACVVIVILLAFFLWAVRLIVTTQPKSYLFDDPSTVLLYGPLYNTFCEDAAVYATVPLILNFTRGIAIGAVQPSGIAQIVLLVVCEVVSILTLLAFRPFPRPTSMNIYHICISVVRLLTVLLSVCFVPSLNASESARGWIGYVILVLHAAVLVFGFFLNALQTLVEVGARLAGAGDYNGGATRGGLVKVLGMRQLSRRVPRRRLGRHSVSSEAAMLAQAEGRMSSQLEMSRPRSISGSSAVLLQRKTAGSNGRGSMGIESRAGARSRTPSGGFDSPPMAGGGGGSAGETKTAGSSSSRPTDMSMLPQDPYYRPPRPRKRTVGAAGALDTGEGSLSNLQNTTNAGDADEDGVDSPLVAGGATPTPAYIPAPKDDLDEDDSKQTRKDYAVREVDFYYGVRGPPLSHAGTRRLKTGPADPTGPVSSATSWLRNVFRGKTKEKGKGFEVVRSARAPPPGLMGESFNEPYRDDPENTGSQAHTRHVSETSEGPYRDSDGDEENTDASGSRKFNLPPIDVGGGIELPSRVGSHAGAHPPSIMLDPPAVPRKSSKRKSTEPSSHTNEDEDGPSRSRSVDNATDDGPPGEPSGGQSGADHEEHPTSTDLSRSNSEQLHPGTGRLPFSTNSSISAERNPSLNSTTASMASSRQGHRDDDDGGNGDGHQNDGPSTVGYVVQYRASDSIRQAGLDEPSYTESTAELVDEPLRPVVSRTASQTP